LVNNGIEMENDIIKKKKLKSIKVVPNIDPYLMEIINEDI
jgi:hypothetical protein